VFVDDGHSDSCTEGQIAFMQLYYEIDNACTSIVVRACPLNLQQFNFTVLCLQAHNPNGTIFHARNLDYSLPGLENITANVQWMKNNETLFYSTQYIGCVFFLLRLASFGFFFYTVMRPMPPHFRYMGVLTGMRPNGWSVSVNQVL
jgi:hypothetical protein